MSAQFWETFVLLSIAGAAVALVIRLLLPRVLAWRGVWFSWHTRFGPALVFDSSDADGTTVRLLNVGGTFQSVCYVDEDLLWDPVCEYHRSWALLVHKAWPLKKRGGQAGGNPSNRNAADRATPPRADASRRALVMGGGGYSFPKWMVAFRPDFYCETVEIDPAITQIAREQFFLGRLEEEFETKKNGRLAIAHADAWAYLQSDTKGYDLIVNDAFRGNRPLGPMATQEGAAVVRAHLRAGGRYIGNIRCALEGSSSRVLRDTTSAFEQVFDHVEIIQERPEEPRKKGNNALVAWNDNPK